MTKKEAYLILLDPKAEALLRRIADMPGKRITAKEVENLTPAEQEMLHSLVDLGYINQEYDNEATPVIWLNLDAQDDPAERKKLDSLGASAYKLTPLGDWYLGAMDTQRQQQRDHEDRLRQEQRDYEAKLRQEQRDLEDRLRQEQRAHEAEMEQRRQRERRKDKAFSIFLNLLVLILSTVFTVLSQRFVP